MTTILDRSGIVNGDLWGQRAADWANIQEPTLVEVYDQVFSRAGVNAGTEYLDLACGLGLAVAKAVARGANVTGLEASQALLDVARARLPGTSFHTGKLEELPFDSGRFDVVTSFNGIQYAAHPVRALIEAKRVTKPSGIVAIVTWGEPDDMDAASVIAALKPLLPPPPLGAPGPFALSNKTVLRQFAAEGGLIALEVFDVNCPWVYPDLETAVKGLSSSGVAAKAIMKVGSEAVDEAHAAALTPFEQADGSIKVGATFRVLLARSR